MAEGRTEMEVRGGGGGGGAHDLKGRMIGSRYIGTHDGIGGRYIGHMMG